LGDKYAKQSRRETVFNKIDHIVELYVFKYVTKDIEIKDESDLKAYLYNKTFEIDLIDCLLLRKINDSTFLLICDCFRNAGKIVNVKFDVFKVRFLKDSPDSVRYVDIYLEIKLKKTITSHHYQNRM
jgi:hypothetical protein